MHPQNLTFRHLAGQARIMKCLTPIQNTKITFKFQMFSPNPRGFLWQPDETYYLICE